MTYVITKNCLGEKDKSCVEVCPVDCFYDNPDKKLNEKYPEGDIIRIVCDNHSAHKSKETRNFLATSESILPKKYEKLNHSDL